MTEQKVIAEFRKLQTESAPIPSGMNLAGTIPIDPGRFPFGFDRELDSASNGASVHVIGEITDATFTGVRYNLSMDLARQSSVVLPDLIFVAHRSYSAQRPTASDTHLLIEVSDTTLAYDLGDKMRIYASENVGEYWVIDIPHRSLIVHRDPAAGRFRSVQTFDEHQPVQSETLSNVTLLISTLFR